MSRSGSQVTNSMTKTSEKPTWNNWWQQKRKNNQDFLSAAETGNLKSVQDFLSPEVMKDLVVDLNCKGHDHWHALHFASNEGQVEIVEYLLQRPKIEV